MIELVDFIRQKKPEDRMDGWVDGWLNRQTHIHMYAHTHKCTHTMSFMAFCTTYNSANKKAMALPTDTYISENEPFSSEYTVLPILL